MAHSRLYFALLIFYVIPLSYGSSLITCPVFETESLAQAYCTNQSAVFSAYLITQASTNAKEYPYFCSGCGYGLICDDGTCPIISTREEWENTACPKFNISVHGLPKCQELQSFCEDNGHGWLIYARTYFFFPGSAYNCLGCSGFNNVEIGPELSVRVTFEQPFNSPFFIILFLVTVILYLLGYVLDFYGRATYEEEYDEDLHVRECLSNEFLRAFAVANIHGKKQTLWDAIIEEIFLAKLLRRLICRCTGCSNRHNEMSPEEIRRERRLVNTYTMCSLLMAISIAYLLNDVDLISTQCHFSFGNEGLDAYNPYFWDNRAPERSIAEWPDFVSEDIIDVFTVVDKLDIMNSQVTLGVISGLVVEEAIFICFMIALESFLRGAESMKPWNLDYVHYIVRFCVLIFTITIVIYQQIQFEVQAVVIYVILNSLVVLILLFIFLPLLAIIRWTIGKCIIQVFALHYPDYDLFENLNSTRGIHKKVDDSLTIEEADEDI